MTTDVRQTNIKLNTRAMTMTGMLAAVASVLMFVEFPLPIFPSFVKLDFSDLPALIAAFALGPIAGFAVELVKNLVHLTQTQTGGIGELANFLVGCALVVPAGYIYQTRKTRKSALLGMGVGAITMAAVGALANYFILIPFFTAFMPLDAIISMCAAIIPTIDSLETMILLSIVPFNLLKAAVVSGVTYLVYKRLSRFIQGNH